MKQEDIAYHEAIGALAGEATVLIGRIRRSQPSVPYDIVRSAERAQVALFNYEAALNAKVAATLSPREVSNTYRG